MDKESKLFANEVVTDSISPYVDKDEQIDEEENELSGKALMLMIEAAKKWRDEHGENEHCEIEVTRGKDNELTVKVTPKGE